MIALRLDSDSYALIDLFTIVDGKIISLFTDEMSESTLYKRSGFILLENGNVVYETATWDGDKYGVIYELKEEEMAYAETIKASSEAGDYEIIEKEIENMVNINTLDWKTIGKEQDSTVSDDFMAGDFSAIEGIWKSGYDNEGSLVRIEGNELFYENGGRLIITYSKEYSDEESFLFGLMEEDGVGGAILHFFPENIDIEINLEFVSSDSNQKKIFRHPGWSPRRKRYLL